MSRHDAVPTRPAVLTELPGPRSRAVFAEEQSLLGGGHSAGSAWAGLAIERGSGAMVRDVDGNWFLDGCSGTVVMNIGHGHPKIAEALEQQASLLTHFYDFASPTRVTLLKRLATIVPGALDRFHITNSGTEAVEAALRIARSATGRHEVVAFHQGYHGRTLGALSLTTGSGREGLGPLLPGVAHAASAYCYRCPVGREYPSCGIACLGSFDALTANALTQTPAAVVVEPMQGAGGMIPLPHEFLAHLREYCDRTGALLVFDEVLTGVGRTGRMWAWEHSGVMPDLLVFGKGVAGGFPIGIVAGAERLLHAGPVALPTRNSSTFGGGQLACAAADAALGVLVDEGLVENAARVGDWLLTALVERLADMPLVGDVRGLGLAIGVEMVDTDGRPVGGHIAERVLTGLRDRGVLVSSGNHVLRVTPPLCISEDQAAVLCDAVVDTLREIQDSGSVR